MSARARTLVTVAVAALLTVSACGAEKGTERPEEQVTAVPSTPQTSTTTASTPAAPEGTVIKIVLKGDTVSPSGKRLKAKLDTPIVLQISADKAGEIHVHSTPEKQIAFPVGDSTQTLTFDQPGIVDVEDHGLDKLIVQLEVR